MPTPGLWRVRRSPVGFQMSLCHGDWTPTAKRCISSMLVNKKKVCRSVMTTSVVLREK